LNKNIRSTQVCDKRVANIGINIGTLKTKKKKRGPESGTSCGPGLNVFLTGEYWAKRTGRNGG